MQTPIDFGKQFLNNYFDARDEEKCLEDLASDLVWITPKQMYHFLTDKEVRDYLHEEIKVKAPERRFVDIVSIKSSPSVTDISTVAFELNLVPKEEEKAVHLRCSMAVVKRGTRYEITFIHMSEKLGGGGTEQIREFTANLPCGVLIFAYMKGMGLRTVFYNDYFHRKLHYKEENFQRQMDRDPFFMIAEEEREKLIAKLDETGGREPFTINMTFFRRDGNRFYYRMIAAPAYQEGENIVFYSIFQETTGFNRMHAQMREQMATASDILGNIPGGLCVLTGEIGEWKPVYVTRKLPERFGLSMTGFAKAVSLDPFYGLEMTSITKKRLTETHLEMLSQNPYVGMFQMVFADGTKRWTDVYLVNAADHNGDRLRMLFYVDKEEERQAMDRQIAKAENASRLQQERARMEVREAQERARQQVEEAQTTVRKEIEDAQAKTQEQIESFRVRMNQILDSQKGTVKEQERVLQATYEAREKELVKSYEEKEKGLDQQIENYRKAQEAELAKRQKAMDTLTAEYEKELSARQSQIEKLEQENERVMHDLRESETLRESQLSASKMRERDSSLRERELTRRDSENQAKIQQLTELVASLQKELDERDAFGGEIVDGGLAAGGVVAGGAVAGGLADAAGGMAGGAAGVAASGLAGGAVAGGLADAAGGLAGSAARGRSAGAASEGGAQRQKYGRNNKSGWLFDNIMHPAQTADMRRGENAGVISDLAETLPTGGTPQRTTGTAVNAAQPVFDDMEANEIPSVPGGTAANAAQAMPDNMAADTSASASNDIAEEEEGDVLFDIEELMQEVLRLQEPLCKRRRIHLELRRSTSMPPQAIGNRAGLHKALLSLMESAAEQTPEGGMISLGGRADRASGNRAYLYFTIRDNGSGIASELMTGMFDKKDERSDPLRAGLYNAREIISAMGGNVRVRSRRGEGTEFTVTVCMNLPPRKPAQR